MRIGIFSDRYLPQIDGVCYSIETFREQLEAMGHEVYIFAPRPAWNYRERSKHVIRFPAVRGLFFEDYLLTLYFPPQAIRKIDKLNLDVVHFQTPGQIGLLGAYYATHYNKPLITTYHTDLFQYVLDYPNVMPGTVALSMLVPAITRGGRQEYRQIMSSIRPQRNINAWHQKILAHSITVLHNQCDLVITPSSKIKMQLESWKTTSPIAVLPTGVEKIATNSAEISAARRKYGISLDDQVISCVCRIGTEKNISLLIQSFANVARRNDRAKLMLVGAGDDLDRFTEQARQTDYADRIIFTGQIDRKKLGAIYGLTKVFAFPSLKDTQGLAVNEAACAGLPIVIVDHEISEVVRDGQNGYFANNSIRDFAAKIARILSADDEQRHKMSQRSVELGSQVTPGKQAAKLLRLYEQAIEHHRDKPQLKSSKPAER